MKFTRIAAIMLALIMLLALVACDSEKEPQETTATPAESSSVPEESGDESVTEAPENTKSPETTASPETQAPETKAPETTAEITEAPPKGDTISADDMTVLRLAMPAQLPDNSDFSILTRLMCCDNEDDYIVSGNSATGTKYVDEQNGAIFGKAIAFPAKDMKNTDQDKRGEITLTPANDVVSVAGAKGILFYVDMSAVTTQENGQLCASVTINTNDIRSRGPENANNSAVAYYYLDGLWVQTTNINVCRLALPDAFKGWIYVPATSFYQDYDGRYWDSATGCFNDFFFISNMRCYTDGYVYNSEQFIIFDEITFVK